MFGYDFFNLEAKAAAAKAAEKEKSRFSRFKGNWELSPVKPSSTVSGKVYHAVQLFKNDPVHFREKIEKNKMDMAKSFRQSKLLLPKLIREYHRISDPCFIDEYEVKTISVKLLIDQIEKLKSRIKLREISSKLRKVEFVTSAKELGDQLESKSGDLSKIEANAVVKFSSVEDVTLTFEEMRMNEADIKECLEKWELVNKLQKDIDDGVGYNKPIVKSGGEAFYLISLEKDDLEERIKEERRQIAQYPKEDLEKFMLPMPNISRYRILLPYVNHQ